jgi:hypothetical protein
MKTKKKNNDRTWCFWQIEKATETIHFKKNGIQHFSPTLILSKFRFAPYQYNMVQGLDFLQSSFDFILNEKTSVMSIKSNGYQ